MLQKITAIVLHSMKYKESSLLVYTYTNIFGKQTYIVNGVRSEKNKTGMALFQPLTLLEAIAYHNPKSDLQRLGEYRLQQPLQSIPFDITKNALALFMGEILHKTIREHEPNSELFDFIYRAILDLDKLQEGVANFHLYFLVHLCHYLGYAPDKNHYQELSFFDAQLGEFTTLQPSHDLFFDTEQTLLFTKLAEAKPESLSHLSLNRDQRNLFITNMLRFLNHHFDSLVTIRSVTILQEIFN